MTQRWNALGVYIDSEYNTGVWEEASADTYIDRIPPGRLQANTNFVSFTIDAPALVPYVGTRYSLDSANPEKLNTFGRRQY